MIECIFASEFADYKLLVKGGVASVLPWKKMALVLPWTTLA